MVFICISAQSRSTTEAPAREEAYLEARELMDALCERHRLYVAPIGCLAWFLHAEYGQCLWMHLA